MKEDTNLGGVDMRNLIDRFKNMPVQDIKNILHDESFDFHIAIENLQHDFNIGSIVRSANAFNARAVHIIGKKHWNRRGAMSTEKYLDVIHHPDAVSFIQWAHTVQLPLVAIDNVGGSIPLSSTVLPKKCVLIFGQEGPGLSLELREASDVVVHIEQFGSTRSVNVGAAAAIVMYQWVYTHSLRLRS